MIDDVILPHSKRVITNRTNIKLVIVVAWSPERYAIMGTVDGVIDWLSKEDYEVLDAYLNQPNQE